MNPEHLTRLCTDYDLGRPVSHRELHGGVLNQNYLLTTEKGSYFVKGVREKKKNDIPYIAAVESYMRENGIPAVCMLRSGSASYAEYDSQVYTVYPFLEGSEIAGWDLSDYIRMGKMLARIHRAGAAVPESLKTHVFKEKGEEVIIERLTGYRDMLLSKNRDEVDGLFLAYIEAKLALIPTLTAIELSNDTLVHGDYHERNLLFSPAREIIGVCDWEKSEWSPRSYELARSTQYICFEGEPYDPELALEQGRAFLTGYRDVYPIEATSVMAGFNLRLRKLAYSVWIEEQYYERNDSRANKFIAHEMQLMQDFSRGMAERLLAGF